MMPPSTRLTWQAYEYEYREKNRTWFWVLGIIGAGAFLAAIFLENFLFAVLIMISVVLLALFAARKPRVLTYHITESDLTVEDRVFPYKELRAFWVSEESSSSPKLLIEARSTLTPLLSITLNDTDPEKIRRVLKNYLKEEEIQEPFAHHLLTLLGL